MDDSNDDTHSWASDVPETPTPTFEDYEIDYIHEDGEDQGPINVRKRKLSMDNWEREIKDGKLIVRQNIKDLTYSFVFNS